MTDAFHIEQNGQGNWQLHGPLDLYHVHTARQQLEKLLPSGQQTLDLSGLTRLDTVGALLLRRLQEQTQAQLVGFRPEHQALFALVSHVQIGASERVEQEPSWRRLLKRLGEQTLRFGSGSMEIIGFFGHVCVALAASLRSPRHMRFSSIMHHIEETGIQAVPIIALIAFLIAVVLAYQGIAQLRPLGGEQYTVNLVSISVLREMGVLLTAIMVAGRSGSAFTAEIGVMKVREEVDALQVIGVNPFEVLVMPRLIALIIALPLLTFLADLSGLAGGGLVSMLLINIPPEQYMARVRAVVHLHDFVSGLIKAPVFAFLIATVGCMHGMKVAGSAESVGKQTTSAVVKAIFLVLVADAFFSILFQKVGI